MEPGVEALRGRVDGLSRELSELTSRIERLEARTASASGEADAPIGAAPATAEDAAQAGDSAQAAAIGGISLARLVALIGRTLVILGGGYLFRALTDAALVPALVGVAAGLLYGAWWLIAADRAAAAEDRTSAIFYGLVAAMIVCPLVWETTARFELLAPSAAAALLVTYVGFGLVVARRGDLEPVAWISVLFGVATTFALLFGTRAWLPIALGLVALAAVVEVFAIRGGWLGLRWPAALGANLGILILLTIALREGESPDGSAPLAPSFVIAVSLALPILYLATIAVRTLLREHTMSAFEAVQASAALLVGFGGAARVVVFDGASPAPLGIAGALLGAACYAVAFAIVDRRLGRGINFYSYSSFACGLILAGSGMILPSTALAILWSALALAAVWLGGRFDRITLRFHGVAYLTAAAFVCGLVALAWNGLAADVADLSWHATPVCLLVALTSAACYAMLVGMPTARLTGLTDLLPRAIGAAVIALVAAGLAAGGLAGTLLAAGPEAGPAFVAASRTAIVAVLAVALAWAAQRWSLTELGWLVYPLLVGAGIKLLFEDFGYSHPVALFLTLAFYGGALVVTPRLLRKTVSP
jgi:hypothetical protein